MRNNSVAIIAPATAAGTGRFVLEKWELPARLSAGGLAGAEAVTLSVVDGDDTAEVVTAVSQGGTAVTLTATNTMVTLTAPGPYEVAKPATVGAAGVYLAKR
jgi:hypothetical protein